MNTKRVIISEIEQMAVNAIVHQPDDKAAAEKHFSETAKKIVETAMQAIDIMEIGDICRRAVTGAPRAPEATEAELHEAATEEPSAPVSAAPRGVTTLPPGADGTPPAAAKKRHYLDFDFCGMKLACFGGKGLETKFIGKKVNPNAPDNLNQIFEIKVKRPNAVVGSVAEATENGELLFRIESQVNFNFTRRMAVSCLHRLLEARIKSNSHRYDLQKRHRKAKAQAGEVA